MSKTLLTAIFGLATFALSAQNIFLTPDSTNQIIVNGTGGVASSSIPQSFMNKFLFPDFIDNETKQIASDKMRDNNFFGGSVKGNFNFMFGVVNDTSNTNNIFGFGFGTNIEGNSQFTKDLFNVTFFGNKPYAGQTLNLNETKFKALSYSYLEVSLGKSIQSKAQNIQSAVWADLGLVVGHGYTDFNLKNASIFTEQNGDYLDINISESTLTMSDSLSTSLTQGFGAKFDLHYSRKTKKSNLLFSMENIGGIFWQNTANADVDTTFKFEGIEIGNIFQLSDSVWNELGSVDSLLKSEKKDQFRALPVDFSLYYRQNMDLIYFDILVRHRLYANYTPMLRAGLNFDLPFVKPGATIAYGGYSSLKVGLNTDVVLANILKIQIGTNNILGAIFPNSFNALDAYLGARLTF